MSTFTSKTASRTYVGVCYVQGIYYLITAVWPIVDVRSFQWVTGPKTDHLVTGRESDHWLLMTVSVLILAVALPLLLSAYRRIPSSEVILLGLASAIALTAIDIIYTGRGVISPIYLLDAALELVFIVTWIILLLVRKGQSS
jgi:hypothetical protein